MTRSPGSSRCSGTGCSGRWVLRGLGHPWSLEWQRSHGLSESGPGHLAMRFGLSGTVWGDREGRKAWPPSHAVLGPSSTAHWGTPRFLPTSRPAVMVVSDGLQMVVARGGYTRPWLDPALRLLGYISSCRKEIVFNPLSPPKNFSLHFLVDGAYKQNNFKEGGISQFLTLKSYVHVFIVPMDAMCMFGKVGLKGNATGTSLFSSAPQPSADSVTTHAPTYVRGHCAFGK